MAITGFQDSDTLQFANDGTTLIDSRPKNYREGILLNEPNGSAPLTALSSLMRTESTDDPEYSWFEKIMPTMRVELSASILVGATTIPLIADSFGGGNQFIPGTVLLAEETFELMLVTAIASSTSITVSRGFGGTTAVAITLGTENPNLSAIGTALEEGAPSPNERSYNPNKRFSYTQIHRYPIGLTRTAKRTRLRTKDALTEMKREGLEQHSNQIERASFFSAASEDLTGTHPRRSTDGLYNVLLAGAPTNIITAPPAAGIGGVFPDIDWLEETMFQIFDRGSDQKMGFCGNRFMLNIQAILRKGTDTPYTFSTGDTEYGMRIARLISPFGELVLKRHPLFNDMKDDPALTWFGMSSGCAILDMANVRWRPMKGDDTRYIPDTTDKGVDGDRSEFLTEGGFEFAEANTHFWINGLAAAVVPS